MTHTRDEQLARADDDDDDDDDDVKRSIVVEAVTCGVETAKERLSRKFRRTALFVDSAFPRIFRWAALLPILLFDAV